MEQISKMKIIASDLDGTLLNSKFQSDEVIDLCIKNIVSSNNRFIVATGRTLNGVNSLSLSKFPIYKIVMNGAMIYDERNILLKSFPINEKIVKEIDKMFPHSTIEYITQKNNYMTISKEKYIQEYSKWEYWSQRVLSHDKSMLENHISHFIFNSDIQSINEDILKINILELTSDKVNQKIKLLSKFNMELENVLFNECVLELTNIEATKLNALNYLKSVNEWSDKDIIVFGDGDNDLEMLNYFENSYSPSSASIEAKLNASYVLDDVPYAVVEKINSLIGSKK